MILIHDIIMKYEIEKKINYHNFIVRSLENPPHISFIKEISSGSVIFCFILSKISINSFVWLFNSKFSLQVYSKSLKDSIIKNFNYRNSLFINYFIFIYSSR